MATETNKTSRYSGISDPIFLNEASRRIENAVTSRSRLASTLMDPRRDLDHEFGYPATRDITVENYWELYERFSIATRVVEVYPKESWSVVPELFETEEVEQVTAFEKAWKDLQKAFTEESWLLTDDSNLIWEALERVDILSGVGRYGVLLLGLDDGKELNEPVEGTKHQLLYVRAFSENLAKITAYESDKENPRYGKPLTYSITLTDPNNPQEATATTTKTIHHSRVIHVADNLGSSELFGRPRQLPVLNDELNLLKIYGGSAEMYFRGAFPGLSLETHPQLGGDVNIDMDSINDDLEQWANSLQRSLVLSGMSAKSLAPQVVDPSPQIDAHIKAICIQLAVPKRVFEGSERGELASSQDIQTWYRRLGGRQDRYITPRIIAPFINRLIMYGVLPKPTDGYNVKWPSLFDVLEGEKADTAVKQTEAITKFIQGGGESMIPPAKFLNVVVGFDREEANAMVEETVDVLIEENTNEDDNKDE